MTAEFNAILYTVAIYHKIIKAQVCKEYHSTQFKPRHSGFRFCYDAPDSRNYADDTDN